MSEEKKSTYTKSPWAIVNSWVERASAKVPLQFSLLLIAFNKQSTLGNVTCGYAK